MNSVLSSSPLPFSFFYSLPPLSCNLFFFIHPNSFWPPPPFVSLTGVPWSSWLDLNTTHTHTRYKCSLSLPPIRLSVLFLLCPPNSLSWKGIHWDWKQQAATLRLKFIPYQWRTSLDLNWAFPNWFKLQAFPILIHYPNNIAWTKTTVQQQIQYQWDLSFCIKCKKMK